MGRYVVAAGLARLADEMVGLAVVLLVLARTGQPVLAGAMVTAYTLPALVSGPLLGAWLDRTRRRRRSRVRHHRGRGHRVHRPDRDAHPVDTDRP